MEYYNPKTGEVVPEDCAETYVKEKLSIEIKPIGKENTYTQEQIEFINIFIEWYFSGEWIEQEIDDIPNLERDLVLADMKYQDKLDREWGI